MIWRKIAVNSFEALIENKLRSMLTMLGMIIGVLAVILLVSVGTGAKRYITNEFESLGTNMILIQPGRTDKESTIHVYLSLSDFQFSHNQHEQLLAHTFLSQFFSLHPLPTLNQKHLFHHNE